MPQKSGALTGCCHFLVFVHFLESCFLANHFSMTILRGEKNHSWHLLSSGKCWNCIESVLQIRDGTMRPSHEIINQLRDQFQTWNYKNKMQKRTCLRILSNFLWICFSRFCSAMKSLFSKTCNFSIAFSFSRASAICLTSASLVVFWAPVVQWKYWWHLFECVCMQVYHVNPIPMLKSKPIFFRRNKNT